MAGTAGSAAARATCAGAVAGPLGERLLPAQTEWAVVLLPAWTGSYASWAHQQGPLAVAGNRVISYGGGRS